MNQEASVSGGRASVFLSQCLTSLVPSPVRALDGTTTL